MTPKFLVFEGRQIFMISSAEGAQHWVSFSRYLAAKALRKPWGLCHWDQEYNLFLALRLCPAMDLSGALRARCSLQSCFLMSRQLRICHSDSNGAYTLKVFLKHPRQVGDSSVVLVYQGFVQVKIRKTYFSDLYLLTFLSISQLKQTNHQLATLTCTR